MLSLLSQVMVISFPCEYFFPSERISYDLLLFQIIQFYRKNVTLFLNVYGKFISPCNPRKWIYKFHRRVG